MITARNAFNDLSDQVTRLKTILSSVESERRELSREISKAHEDLKDTFMRLYPRLADAPLEQLSAAARAADGEQARDYTHMATALLAEDARTDDEYKQAITRYGEPDRVATMLRARNEEIADSQRNTAQLKRTVAATQPKIEELTERLRLIDRANEHLAKRKAPTITDANAASFETFALGKWLLDRDWRAARAAVTGYRQKDGDSLRKDRADLSMLQSRMTEAETSLAKEERRLKDTRAAIVNLQSVSDRMANLKRARKGEAAIYDTIYANFAELLSNEAAAQAIGRLLPKAKAQALLAFALKFNNLGKMDANLRLLQKRTQSTIGELETPLGKLRKLARSNPSHKIKFDPASIDAQLQPFQTAATAFVRQSGDLRRATLTYTPARSTSTRPSSSTATSDDDLYMAMNLHLLSSINNNLALSLASSPSTAHISVPDVAAFDVGGSSFSSALKTGAFDLPNIDVPAVSLSIPDTGGFSTGGGFGGGGSSGWSSGDSGGSWGGGGDSGGGGGGGGCDITANFHPQMPSWAPGRPLSVLQLVV